MLFLFQKYGQREGLLMAAVGVGLAFSVFINLCFALCWFSSAVQRCTRGKAVINQPVQPVEGHPNPKHESTRFYSPPPPHVRIVPSEPSRRAPILTTATASTHPNQSTISTDLEVSFDHLPHPSPPPPQS